MPECGRLNEVGGLTTFITWVPSRVTGTYHKNRYSDPVDNTLFSDPLRDLEPLERGHVYRWTNLGEDTLVFMPYRVLDKEVVTALRHLNTFMAQQPFSPGLRVPVTPANQNLYGVAWQHFTLSNRQFLLFKVLGEKAGWDFIAGLTDTAALQTECLRITDNITEFLEKVRVLRETAMQCFRGSTQLAQVETSLTLLRTIDLEKLGSDYNEFCVAVGQVAVQDRVNIQTDISLLGELWQSLHQINWSVAQYAEQALPEAAQNARQGAYVALGQELAALTRAFPVLNILSFDAVQNELRITLGQVVVWYDGTKLLVDGDINTLKNKITTEQVGSADRLRRVEQLDDE